MAVISRMISLLVCLPACLPACLLACLLGAPGFFSKESYFCVEDGGWSVEDGVCVMFRERVCVSVCGWVGVYVRYFRCTCRCRS